MVDAVVLCMVRNQKRTDGATTQLPRHTLVVVTEVACLVFEDALNLSEVMEQVRQAGFGESGCVTRDGIVRLGANSATAFAARPKSFSSGGHGLRPRPSTQHPAAKMPSTYKKDKPWDTDDIDKWKVCCHSLLSTSILHPHFLTLSLDR